MVGFSRKNLIAPIGVSGSLIAYWTRYAGVLPYLSPDKVTRVAAPMAKARAVMQKHGRAGASRKCGRGSFRDTKKALAPVGCQALERSIEKIIARCSRGAGGKTVGAA
jgi:hypothetical protein